MPKILVIEDHETTRRTIALYLERDGFCVETEADGQNGLARVLESEFALVIVDLMLPGLDGREICKRLRKQSSTPIIMLTALSTEDDIIRGLGLGADDYMSKPFSPRELVARVRARLRTKPENGRHISVGGLTLDLEQRELRAGVDPVTLTNTEYRILETLMKAPGRAFSRDELIERALGHNFDGSQKNIDIHISNLRKRIEPDRLKPEYILTVSGHGYRFRTTESSDGNS
jgi:DNA-binding response OmpR family regulator